MVLADIAPFVESWVFADLIAGEMRDAVDPEAIHGMVSGSRYSRAATVEVAGSDAAAEAFPGAVSGFVIADGNGEATVRVIDPPQEPERGQLRRWVRIGAVRLLGAGLAIVIPMLVGPVRRSRDLLAS